MEAPFAFRASVRFCGVQAWCVAGLVSVIVSMAGMAFGQLFQILFFTKLGFPWFTICRHFCFMSWSVVVGDLDHYIICLVLFSWVPNQENGTGQKERQVAEEPI